MFKGHQFIKLVNDNWVLDLTEYVGYKVRLNENREVASYREAFSVTEVGDELIFEKYTSVPLKILKEASSVIRNYNEFIKE